MRGKILVVEDDVFLVESIRDILEYDGYHVITANSGQSGLAILKSDPHLPDLIVSDIMMPEMDGYEFLHHVRAEALWVDIPFIFLTAKGERQDENLGKELGADDYITKPFAPEDLLIGVSSKLRRHRQLRLQRDQQINQIKQNILTILHHEFRTPLTYVVAYSDLLKGSADNISVDNLRAFLVGIDKGARRLRRLVEDFILLVELETGEGKESFALHGLVLDDYESLISPLREEYNVALFETPLHQPVEFSIEPDLPPILAYRDYLIKALDCLLDNAVKFGGPNNQIALRVTSNRDGNVCFYVSDTGRGIPAQELPLIFEPFYQIARDYHEDQGAGAGLAIVKGIIDLHNGQIEVDSVLEEGSTFTIVLPPHRQ